MFDPARANGPPGWVRDAIFYQIFPDRFARSGHVAAPGPLEDWDSPPTVHGFKGGDLLGIAEHLDYLVDLGVNALYLNPIFASASNHRYQTYDYLHVDPLLGGDPAFRVLLDQAHRREMRVVIDATFNHVGRGFWPFHHVLETGRHSPYRDWFLFSERYLDSDLRIRAYPDAQLPGAIPSTWADEHGEGHQSQEAFGYRAWWDLPALPKLNTPNPHVRDYLMGVADTWTAFGVDGWRLDVPEEIEATGFWEEFRERVKGMSRDAYLVGEVWRVAPEWCGSRFDGLMNYPLAWAILGFAGRLVIDRDVVAEHAHVASALRPLTGREFGDRLTSLYAAYDGPAAASHLNLLGSHDTPRIRTMLSDDLAAVRLAFLLLVTLPGAPCVYYGDEIGMRGRADPDCRGAFPWNRQEWDSSLRTWVREAIRLRAAEPALRADGLEVLAATTDTCAYLRSDGDTRALIAANAGSEARRLTIGVTAGSSLRPLFATDGLMAPSLVDGGRVTLTLPPRGATVFRVAS